MWETFAVVLTAIAMTIGLAGVVLPILPGLWLIWVSALIYGFFAGFGAFGVGAMVFITVVAVAGTYVVVRVPQQGAASVGVPWWGQLLAAALSVVGMFLIPIVGAILGFVVGVLLMQVLLTRSISRGLGASVVVLRSMAMAAGMQLIAGLTMMVTWVLWVLVA